MTPPGGGPKYLRTLCWQGTNRCSAFLCPAEPSWLRTIRDAPDQFPSWDGICVYETAFNQPLSAWDVSAVTTMEGMFQFATSLKPHKNTKQKKNNRQNRKETRANKSRNFHRKQKGFLLLFVSFYFLSDVSQIHASSCCILWAYATWSWRKVYHQSLVSPPWRGPFSYNLQQICSLCLFFLVIL